MRWSIIVILSILTNPLSATEVDVLIKDAEKAKKANNHRREGDLYLKAANHYIDAGDYKEAKNYAKKSDDAYKDAGISLNRIYSKMVLANAFDKLGRIKKAIAEYDEAKKLAIANNKNDELLICYMKLAKLYQQSGNSAKQEEYKLLVETFDESKMTESLKQELGSVISDLKGTKTQLIGTKEELESAKDTIETKTKQNQAQAHQLEVQEHINRATRAELQATEAENKAKNTVIIALVGGILLIVAFTFLVIRGYRIQKVQNEIIREQKKGIEDSIAYAKGLQSAILPREEVIRSHLPDSFILYKPKDVISGDFYWFEEKGSMIFFAVADCTGHGVPGAMVSMVCSNALRQAVNEYYLTDPGQILDKARELLKLSFANSKENVKDGMDIALCMLDKNSLNLHYAGANNPLWIIRKDGDEVEEHKGDKQPVGHYAVEKPFNTLIVKLREGDSIYLFSDGYADQFGGKQGKKFKYRALKSKLLEITTKEASSQLMELNNTFVDWKSDYEQVDDVCLMGIRMINVSSRKSKTTNESKSKLRHLTSQ